MTYKGIAKGRTIELEETLPYREGQPVQVSVEPVPAPPAKGSPAAIRRAMHEPPHLEREAVDEMERSIAQDRLPVTGQGIFDAKPGR
jgi:hypothetical protein